MIYFECCYVTFRNTMGISHARLTYWDRDKITDILKCIFVDENIWMSLKISRNFVSGVRINNIPALLQIMVWHLGGAKSLSEPMLANLLAHICATRPRWVNFGDAFHRIACLKPLYKFASKISNKWPHVHFSILEKLMNAILIMIVFV